MSPGFSQKNEKNYRTRLNEADKKEFREQFVEKSPIKGVLIVSIYLVSIYLAIGICPLVGAALHWGYALMLYFLSAMLVVRQMRALENVVHFGSHNNFCRDRKLNDILTNVLAAWPMMQDVRRYRVFHNAHHSHYGSETDPCLARLKNIGADLVNIQDSYDLSLAIARQMPC